MISIECKACGGKEFKKISNYYECAFCGSKYLLDNNSNVVNNIITDAKLVRLYQQINALHNQDRYHEELSVIIEALELDPNSATTLIKLGRCYRLLNEKQKALDAYNRAININPNDGTAYTNIGTIYSIDQNYVMAAQYYEKGLPLISQTEGDYWIAYANYAVVVAKLGNPQRAEQMISEAERHGYPNGAVLRQMAGLKKKGFFSSLFS